MKRILVDGGYIQGGKYYFYQTDHLGNNRVVLDANGGRIEDSHYYPFGMAFGAHASVQPYKYNNKELDLMHGLNQYDYSARYYEPAISRFTTVDPLAEKYYSWSPYSFVLGNPIRNIDPFGMDVWTTNDPDQIARFLNHLQSVAGNKTSDPFDYGGWNRMSDDEYKEHNKDNSVSFNDDSFNFNINLEDYQGSFKAGMRSKETNYAYISSSDLDGLFVPEGEEAGLDLTGNVLGLGAGSALWYSFGGGIHKNSALARSIWPPSRVVGTATKTTSLYSLMLHRKGYGAIGPQSKWYLPASKSYAGQLSKLASRTLGPIGAGLALYDAWTIGRTFGQRYGGDARVRSYRQNQRLNSYTPLVRAPK